MDWMKDQFKLCQDVFNTTEHVAQLKDYLNNLWINVAMMDYPYPTSFLMPLPGKPVEVKYDYNNVITLLICL